MVAGSHLELAMAKFLKILEAADIARCSKRSIERAIEDGHLVSFNPKGIRLRLIDEKDLDAWLQPPPPPKRGRGRPRVNTQPPPTRKPTPAP
jgi:excisionase family DNA binding protein